MPSLSTYAVFVATCLALLAIPGPAVLYIVSRSIDQRPATSGSRSCWSGSPAGLGLAAAFVSPNRST